MSKDTFKATSIERKKKSLESKGYKVVEIKNRGVKSVFICEKTNTTLKKEQLEELLGVNIRHPIVMDKYLELLCNSEDDFLYKTDTEVAKLLKKHLNYEFETLKTYIGRCRKELIKANWMKKIVRDKYSINTSKRKYILKDRDTKKIKNVTPEEFSDYYKNIYYKKVRELKVGTNEIFDNPEKNKELNKFISSQARRYLNEQINGDLIIIYKKEFKIGGFNDK